MRIFPVGLALVGFATCNASTSPPQEPAPAEPVAVAEPAEEDAAEAGEAEAGAAEGGEAAADDGEAAADGGAAEGEAADGGTGAEDGGEAPAPDPAGDGGESTPPEPPPEPEPLKLPNRVFSKVNKSCGKAKGVGTKLKRFKLANTKGKFSSNRSWGSRVLLVNFWGTWCKPCLKELPEFDRLFRRYRKHGLTVVAIATDEDPAPVQEYIDKRKLRSRVLIGGENYAGLYGAPTFPFTYVVDSKGVIRASYHGYKPECMGKLEDDIREQLEKRHAAKKK